MYFGNNARYPDVSNDTRYIILLGSMMPLHKAVIFFLTPAIHTKKESHPGQLQVTHGQFLQCHCETLLKVLVTEPRVYFCGNVVSRV